MLQLLVLLAEIAGIGAGLAAGLAVLGAGLGIGRIGGQLWTLLLVSPKQAVKSKVL